MGNKSTIYVADFEIWRKQQTLFNRILIRIFNLSGVFASGYDAGWFACKDYINRLTINVDLGGKSFTKGDFDEQGIGKTPSASRGISSDGKKESSPGQS